MTPFLSNLIVLAAEAGGAAPAAGGPTRSPMQSMYMLALPIGILVLFMVFSSRSHKKRERKRRDLLDSIRPKDDVITIGGIRGRVMQVRDDEVVLRIDPDKDIKITVVKTGISRKADQPEEPQ